MIKIQIAFMAVIFVAALFVVSIWFGLSTQPTLGSVIQGNEYQATTTIKSSDSGTFDGLEQLKIGQGSLAQVTITGANTGVLVFYDATTSNASKRSADRASSTIAIAEISASVAAGTYTFDAEFTDGLLMSRLGGLGPTSTVMWR